MMFITIPPPIKLIDYADGGSLKIRITADAKPITDPWTFAMWMNHFVLPDPQFAKGYEAAKAGSRIREELQLYEVEKRLFIELDDADFQILKAAVMTPTNQQNGMVAAQFFAFMDAICGEGAEGPKKIRPKPANGTKELPAPSDATMIKPLPAPADVT